MTELKRRLLAARAMSDVAAAQVAWVVSLADSLQFFITLRDQGSMTSADVAAACEVEPQFAFYALTTLAASGYVEYDERTATYSLSPEQRSLFAEERDPFFIAGAFQLATGLTRSNGSEVLDGIMRSSRAKFPPLVTRRAAGLLQQVAEIGCGAGATLIELALSNPALRATGVDRNERAIARAIDAAQRANVSARVTFITGDESALAASSYTLVLSLEMLHESSDPVAVARAAHAALQPGGTWLIVEPCGGRGTGNDARFLASLGCLHCLPATGYAPNAPGPLATRETYERIVRDGSFDDVTIEDDGPVHVIIEARK